MSDEGRRFLRDLAKHARSPLLRETATRLVEPCRDHDADFSRTVEACCDGMHTYCGRCGELLDPCEERR